MIISLSNSRALGINAISTLSEVSQANIGRDDRITSSTILVQVGAKRTGRQTAILHL